MHRRFLGPSIHIWKTQSDKLWLGFAQIDNRYMMIRIRKKSNGAWVINFDLDGETTITGNGQTYQIFTIAASAIRDFLSKAKPQLIMVTAKGRSRIRLYKRLNTRFESWGYTTRIVGSRHCCNFIFER